MYPLCCLWPQHHHCMHIVKHKPHVYHCRVMAMYMYTTQREIKHICLWCWACSPVRITKSLKKLGNCKEVFVSTALIFSSLQPLCIFYFLCISHRFSVVKESFANAPTDVISLAYSGSPSRDKRDKPQLATFNVEELVLFPDHLQNDWDLLISKKELQKAH